MGGQQRGGEEQMKGRPGPPAAEGRDASRQLLPVLQHRRGYPRAFLCPGSPLWMAWNPLELDPAGLMIFLLFCSYVSP